MKNLNPSEMMSAAMLGVLVIGVLGIGYLVLKGVSVLGTSTTATTSTSGGGVWYAVGEAVGGAVDKVIGAFDGKGK